MNDGTRQLPSKHRTDFLAIRRLCGRIEVYPSYSECPYEIRVIYRSLLRVDLEVKRGSESERISVNSFSIDFNFPTSLKIRVTDFETSLGNTLASNEY